MDKVFAEVFVIASGVLALATLSVLVSRNANTVGVIGAASSGFGGLITAATAPVTGADMSTAFGRPNFGF